MSKLYRFYEIIPGSLAWTTIILIFLLSWLAPALTAIFIILFDIYWLLKTIYLSFHLRATFSKMRENLKIDWLEKLKKCHCERSEAISITKGLLRRSAPRNDSIASGNSGRNWSNVYHLIILPMYKEPYEVVKESFESLIKTNYPKDKFIVVLATEEQGGEPAQETAKKIQQEFGNKFFKFLIATHPANIANELPGKGSNQAWATKEVKRLIIDPLKIPYENILTSVFDIDTQVLPDYFSRLTYVFLTCENPQRSSFQPIPFFTNNIFQAPALGRVIAFSCTFWQMMQQSRPERLTTFSSHSMPFKALVEIGFWNTDIVSEDSRIFWQCYFHYNADWRVEPLFYPVSMDANVTPKFWQTMLNLYKQQRRWGWGCENIPYMLDGFRKNKKISFRKKIHWAFNAIEGFHSWATNALIIFALGWLPLMLGGADFNFTLLSYSLPQITHWIMTLAMFGIITSAILSVILLPPKPDWFKKRHYFFYFLQWALMPITLIIFGAFPGLEAQTRLMLGGKFRLGFWVTPKQRLNS
ncbi:MAG: glycosyltransferase family 2 protein [bacterium]|nr:glycosyltransferase family 2 protein [bacterium]